MIEIALVCEAHGELMRGRATTEPRRGGVFLGARQLHRATHPECKPRLQREAADAADSRRASERAEAAQRDRAAFEEHTRRAAETAQRRAHGHPGAAPRGSQGGPIIIGGKVQ